MWRKVVGKVKPMIYTVKDMNQWPFPHFIWINWFYGFLFSWQSVVTAYDDHNNLRWAASVFQRTNNNMCSQNLRNWKNTTYNSSENKRLCKPSSNKTRSWKWNKRWQPTHWKVIKKLNQSFPKFSCFLRMQKSWLVNLVAKWAKLSVHQRFLKG